MLERKLITDTIGKTFADGLDQVIFDVGVMVYSKRTMVEVLKCANFMAAARLQKTLKKLDITTPAKLFKTEPMSLLRVRGIGMACVFVAMCILDAHDYSVHDWWGWKETNDLKFGAYKSKAVGKARKRKHEVPETVVSITKTGA